MNWIKKNGIFIISSVFLCAIIFLQIQRGELSNRTVLFLFFNVLVLVLSAIRSLASRHTTGAS